MKALFFLLFVACVPISIQRKLEGDLETRLAGQIDGDREGRCYWIHYYQQACTSYGMEPDCAQDYTKHPQWELCP